MTRYMTGAQYLQRLTRPAVWNAASSWRHSPTSGALIATNRTDDSCFGVITWRVSPWVIETTRGDRQSSDRKALFTSLRRRRFLR